MNQAGGGAGRKADRLLLWLDGEKHDLGGWSEKPLADRIELHLKGEL